VLVLDIRQNNPSARLDEEAGRRFADAARRARYDRDLPGETVAANVVRVLTSSMMPA